MANKRSDAAKAVDTISVEEIDATQDDPTVNHHLAAMQEAAKAEGKEQRKVIAASVINGVETERVLTVKPDGKHTVKENKK